MQDGLAMRNMKEKKARDIEVTGESGWKSFGQIDEAKNIEIKGGISTRWPRLWTVIDGMRQNGDQRGSQELKMAVIYIRD